MWADVYLSVAILCLCCLLLGVAGAGWWLHRKEEATYRMHGSVPDHTHVPNEHDFEVVSAVLKVLLEALDKARMRTDSPATAETLFHIRGFIHTEVNTLLEHIRPRR
jgi:hypothetical protein